MSILMESWIKIRRENHAVAGVIEALLIVALVAVVISTIQLVYIPQVMTQREADHMDVVANQFSTLKSMVDLQVITGSSAPIFSMITLGEQRTTLFRHCTSFRRGQYASGQRKPN